MRFQRDALGSRVAERLSEDSVDVLPESLDRADADAGLDVARDANVVEAERSGERGIQRLEQVTREERVELTQCDVRRRSTGREALAARAHAGNRAELLRADEQAKNLLAAVRGLRGQSEIHVRYRTLDVEPNRRWGIGDERRG